MAGHEELTSRIPHAMGGREFILSTEGLEEAIASMKEDQRIKQTTANDRVLSFSSWNQR